jgi:hypothetical protein
MPAYRLVASPGIRKRKPDTPALPNKAPLPKKLAILPKNSPSPDDLRS